MTRLPNWSTRLQRAVQCLLTQPFAWGVHDCVLFAATCADACTGVDLAAGMRGRYSTARGAYRLVRELTGGTDIAALAAARLGPEVPPALAQRGDVGLAQQAGQAAALLVVCNGAHWLAPGARGLIVAAAPSRAWRV